MAAAKVTAQGAEALPYHRRVSVRYSCGLATATRIQLETDGFFRRAMGLNISQGGMAIILENSPDIGAEVQIRMRNRILNFSYDLSAHVVHANQNDQGKWVVGLQFSRKLSLAELAGLL
jgi:c-di-GMP-binding flagellar brake protein YcgR